MYCSNCGNSIQNSDNCCPQCGNSIGVKSGNTFEGSNNSGVIGQNTINNSTVNIGNLDTGPTFYLNEARNTPLSIAGYPIKSWYIFATGVLGLLGNLASIYSGFNIHPLYVACVAVLSIFPFYVGGALMRARFVRLLFGYNLRSKRNGDVLLTKISGDCPLCDGTLSLVERGPKGHQKTFVQCSRNMDHNILFDHTIFDD